MCSGKTGRAHLHHELRVGGPPTGVVEGFGFNEDGLGRDRKKGSGQKGELAQMLAAQGLYNHSTVPIDEDEYPNL